MSELPTNWYMDPTQPLAPSPLPSPFAEWIMSLRDETPTRRFGMKLHGVPVQWWDEPSPDTASLELGPDVDGGLLVHPAIARAIWFQAKHGGAFRREIRANSMTRSRRRRLRAVWRKRVKAAWGA